MAQILFFPRFLEIYTSRVWACIPKFNNSTNSTNSGFTAPPPVVPTADVEFSSPEPALTVEDFTSAIMSTGLGLPGRTSDRSNEDELGGGCKYFFLFTRICGEILSNFDKHIFQMVWFNHQLVQDGSDFQLPPQFHERGVSVTNNDQTMNQTMNLGGTL